MKFQIIKLLLILVVISFSATSCFDDLEIVPLDEDFNTSEKLYRNPDNYKRVLAKLYAGLAVTGQEGPAGQGDLVDKDEGFSSYLRGYWNLQELTTDEAINAWRNDVGLFDLHDMDWTANNQFIDAMYYRIYYQLPLANEFIRESTDEKLTFREIPANYQEEIRIFREEARFLRALSYWHALDLFRNAPFIPQDAGIGSLQPEQITPQEMFDYIEGELLDLETTLPEPKQNEYGRVDRAAAWMLLAKLYLNAEVYTGQARYTETVTYTNKIINSGAYSLQPVYEHLFLADNHNSEEVIFPILFDGQNTQTWGGMTFIINGSNGGGMIPEDRGVNGAWSGNRTTPGLVGKFDTLSSDGRLLFFRDSTTSYEINSVSEFRDGWGVTKFSNITSTGEEGSNNTHPDTDFPMFRLADAYLMYAEAVLRGGTGGDAATALGYVNALRQRANTTDITSGDLTLDLILDERARELFWEGHRRTDLIRYGLFTGGNYVWPWKGGVKEGQSVDDKFNIFPIPNADLGANPKLIQNPGY